MEKIFNQKCFHFFKGMISFPLFATGVVNTMAKLATGINNTNNTMAKLATGVFDNGGAP
jgi:hypothetical protein